MSRDKVTVLYGIFTFLMVLILGMAYANVTTELKIEGNTVGQEQEGVYITEVEYLTNNGADTSNSKINYFLGTMLDSKVVLGSSTSSTITYKVTIKNNTDREQVFIGIVKDKTDENVYSNLSIQPNVETAEGVTGLEEYVSTIAPGEYITFPVTYAYAGADTSNPELQSKINFRFREMPILELSNAGETYTLENIYAGHVEEYEFTVSNYNQNYNNGVPLTYSFETILTEESPLTAKIYDSEGNEVTESVSMAGDKSTQEDHTYTLKLTWDSSLDSEEYEGKSYACRVNLVAIPDVTVDADLADYGDYSIEQGFEVDITTCAHESYANGECTICGKKSPLTSDGSWDGEVNTPILTADMQPVAWDEEGNEFTPKTNEEWYDYTAIDEEIDGWSDGISNWANAMTEDGSYWVWIPRYEYKITEPEEVYDPPTHSYVLEDAGTIDVRFIPVSTNITTSGYTTTTDVNQTVNGVEVLSKGITVSSDGYIIHPAFTSNVDVGGWDSELPGIWVAKYEMSMETNGVATETGENTETNANVATSNTIKAVSKPGVPTWRNINISNAYENSLAYDTTKESHMIKNSEWGAVAYLTHSQYGRNGTEVSINGIDFENDKFYTAGGLGAKATTNVTQSSTGNATGVFDLSGGASEYVALFNDAHSSTGYGYDTTYSDFSSASGMNMGTTGLAFTGSTKYLTAYSNETDQDCIANEDESEFGWYTSYAEIADAGYTVSITGDAVSELHVYSDLGWFQNISMFVSEYSSPFVDRGYTTSLGLEEQGTGVFSSLGSSGTASWETSFRICLSIDLDQSTCNHTYGNWITIKEPICVEPGSQKRTCSKCNKTELKLISATGEHNVVDGVCTMCGEEFVIVADGSWDGEVNTPILTSDMTPVAWDADGNEYTPTYNAEWYNYVDQASGVDGTSKWANAKTSDGSYWVWIPRYEYKIDASNVTSTSDAGTIDVKFIPTTTKAGTSGYTTTTVANSTVNGVTVLSKGITVSSSGYIIHPAFTSDPDIGGWDSELAGIWVAKYEMSMETNGVATTTSSATIGNVATSSTIKAVSKPGVTSWRNINISNCYENSLTYDSSKNSHLMKNSEWGAVAYLTHSKYGRNGTEVTINSNMSDYTAGGSGASATTNVMQSSTGNATGIYDLSGCAYEFVAAFDDAYSSSGSYYSISSSSYKSASDANMGATGLANGGSTKYLTAYRNGTAQRYIGQATGFYGTSHSEFAWAGKKVSITGDAISEIFVSGYDGWFGNFSSFVNSDSPFLERGGSSNYPSETGIFFSIDSNGFRFEINSSFRVCLADPKDPPEPISTTEAYVGYYADLEGDGTVDGVIFADLAYGATGDGTWTNSNGSYTITKVSSGLKSYYISQESYTGDFGTKAVISPTSGTTGTDRFYVMALSDFDSSTHYWYYNAYGNMSDYENQTSRDFGTGKSNTAAMIEKWNASSYGSQDSNDLWGLIQDKVKEGWFVPSRAEWSAFGEELGITSTNYSDTYGLSYSYWMSTQGGSSTAWAAYFDFGRMQNVTVKNDNSVRLCITF